MNKNENKTINIKDEKFLDTIYLFKERDMGIDGVDDELQHILDTGIVNFENIKGLYSYLEFSQMNPIFYFYELKQRFLFQDKCPYEAIENVEFMISDDEYLYNEIWEYFAEDICIYKNNREVA